MDKKQKKVCQELPSHLSDEEGHEGVGLKVHQMVALIGEALEHLLQVVHGLHDH